MEVSLEVRIPDVHSQDSLHYFILIRFYRVLPREFDGSIAVGGGKAGALGLAVRLGQGDHTLGKLAAQIGLNEPVIMGLSNKPPGRR